MNKLEKKAKVLQLDEEFKTLIMPYLSKEQPFTLVDMPRVASKYLPEFNCPYQTTKFLRDIMVKDLPDIEDVKSFHINIVDAPVQNVDLINQNYVIPPAVATPEPIQPIPAKRRASIVSKTKKRKKSLK